MQHIIEINGKRYISSQAAAGLWGLSQKYVAELCRAGRLPGAFKDTARRWCIPADAPRPLSDDQLKKLLVLSLQLKNDAGFKIDYESLGVEPQDLGALYQYLYSLGYVKKPGAKLSPEKLPYETALSQKGMSLATAALAAGGQNSTANTALEWAKVASALLPSLLKLFE